MKSVYTLLALLEAVVPTFAALATTTRYNDGSEGACGCGSGSPFSWQYKIDTQVFTAAGSQALFDASGSTWCGAGCGICYKLTNQGYSACSTCGTTAGAGESIIVMVTNLCPYNGNERWCPAVGSKNNYGYGAHFDIMSTGLVNGDWDNPVVEYEQVDCPTSAVDDWSQCICHKGVPTLTPTSSTPATYTTTTTKTTSSTSKSSPYPSSSGKPSLPPTYPTSSTPKSSPYPSSSASGTAPLYGQCGGTGWTGPTSCAQGSCVYSNPWYSQCQMANELHVVSSPTPTDPLNTSVPSSTPSSPCNEETAPLGGQCGGNNWEGPTTCAEGTCVFVDDCYSECKKEDTCTSAPPHNHNHRRKSRYIH